MEIRRAAVIMAAAIASTGCNAPRQDAGDTPGPRQAQAATPGTTRADAVVVLIPEDAGRPIPIGLGQRLQVRLPVSPATGYDWSLEEGAPTMLVMETDPGTAIGDAHGGASSRDWTFRAQKRGMATLRFAYRQPWESESARVQAFNLVID